MLTEKEIQDFVSKYGLERIYNRYASKSKSHKKIADHTIDAIARNDCQKLEILSIIGEHLTKRDHSFEDAMWELVLAQSDQLKCPIVKEYKAEALCEDIGVHQILGRGAKEDILNMVKRLV